MIVSIDDQTRQVDTLVIKHKGMDFNIAYGNVSVWKDTLIEKPNVCKIEIMDNNELVWLLRCIRESIEKNDYKLAEKLRYEI